MRNYIRKIHYDELWAAINGKINLIQAVIGPRQVGKTTLALQIFERWNGPKVYETADQPNTPSSEWIASQWEKIRKACNGKKGRGLLILDEVQKISNWSEAVKKFFDEDRRSGPNMRVILLGSSSLLMQRGLTESLAGRFELHRHYQWSFKECLDCFGLGLDEYIFFGGYPGALALRDDEVDFVLKTGSRVKAIEVKSGKQENGFTALKRFAKKYRNVETIVVAREKISSEGIDRCIPTEEFFDNPSDIL